MLRSLYSGVSGLTSHQTKMDVIGNNIANVNTYGFKGSTVSFADIYYQTTGAAQGGTAAEGGIDPSQIGYGTQVASINKNMARSSFQSTASTLDVAIAGNGFLQLQDKAGNIFYSRAGNLKIDDSGNLVDSQGKFVLGSVNATPKDANGLAAVAGSNKVVINVPSVHTGSVTDATAVTSTYTTAPTTPETTFALLNGDQPTDLTMEFDAAGTVDGLTYDGTATPPSITFTLSAATKASITSLESLQTKLNELLTTEMKSGGQLENANYTGGKITLSVTAANYTALSEADRTLLNKDAATDIMTNGFTAEFSTTGTPATITAKPQSKADLDSITISENGTIIGTHSVLGLLTFGRIDLANFNNPEGLEEAGNSYFKQTSASGEAKVAVPGYDGSGSLVSNALEMSNVNLAQEFTDMITAQRGFQANSRIITTSDTLLEELVNLKR